MLENYLKMQNKCLNSGKILKQIIFEKTCFYQFIDVKPAIIYSNKILNFRKSSKFVLAAFQKLLAKEIAKDFATYSSIFYSNNFNRLIAF